MSKQYLPSNNPEPPHQFNRKEHQMTPEEFHIRETEKAVRFLWFVITVTYISGLLILL